MPGDAAGVHADGAHGAVPELRGVPGDRAHDDGAVQQVRQDGARDGVAPAGRLAQLRRDEHVGAPGAQRVLAPEPVVHRRGARPQAGACARVPAPRRELLLVDGRALPTVEELHQFDGRQQAAHAGVAESRGGEHGTP